MNGQALLELDWDDAFARSVPADPDRSNRIRPVLQACFTPCLPTPVRAPKLVAWSREMVDLLGMDTESPHTPEFAQVFAGNQVLPGMRPYAACYGGHQFGVWAGQLGDGRALTLGELVDGSGQRWELQLKGAGPTPYSRRADGRAVLRSSIREFVCSEAMAHLGVPTTRALSLVTTGEQVVRDMFYDGHARPEPGAVVCRVAPSFLRFGSFEILASRGDSATLRTLVDYTIRTHFPALGEPGKEAYLGWLKEVCRTTADMVVHWMRVGFVHGVMNTDNMSIHGLTIDYGPYGWIDAYDPQWTPNTTDAPTRRYRFGHQPQIAGWNLARFADAIAPLVDEPEALQEALSLYAKTVNDGYTAMMANKLGLRHYVHDRDADLIDELLTVLQIVETDMTIFFRRLADVPASAGDIDGDDAAWLTRVEEALYTPARVRKNHVQRIAAWLRRYTLRVSEDGLADAERKRAMNAVNPKYVMRNYLAQLAIDDAEGGDPSGVMELLDVMRRPYDEQPDRQRYADKRPDWARDKPGCSMLSCSS